MKDWEELLIYWRLHEWITQDQFKKALKVASVSREGPYVFLNFEVLKIVYCNYISIYIHKDPSENYMEGPSSELFKKIEKELFGE